MTNTPSPAPAGPPEQTPSGVSAQPARRSLVRRILGVVIYLAFLAVVIEIGLQIFYFAQSGAWLPGRTAQPIYAPNPHTGYWNKPNLALPHNTSEFETMLYTNSQGLRGGADQKDYPLGAHPGVERIMLLGPSFAFGWGVNHEDTFAARLQGLLNAEPKPPTERVEVINAGVPSLGPALSLEWYRKVGKDFAPDLVIQFIYGSMKVPRDKNWSPEDVEVNEEGYLVRRGATLNEKIRAQAKKSAIVFYTWRVVSELRGRMSDEPETKTVEGAGRQLEIESRFDPTSPDVVDALEYYEDLRSTVEASGGKLLIVFFPLSYCIHTQDAARWSHLGLKDIEGQMRYDEDFCRYLAGHNVDCVNITPDLQKAAADGERLYFFVDVHWTAEGNNVAAQAVAAHLHRKDEEQAAAASADSAPAQTAP